jgi:magnesium transporter
MFLDPTLAAVPVHPEHHVSDPHALMSDELFLSWSAHDQAEYVESLPPSEHRLWLRLLAPDDCADVLQQVDEETRERWLGLLDETSRQEVRALLAYAEDDAGGLMNPRFVRVRVESTVEVAIRYIRRQAIQHVGAGSYAYVLDRDQRLVGVVAFRELLGGRPGAMVSDVMNPHPISVRESLDQEQVANLIAETGLIALPVVDDEGRMKGVVTADDVVHVVQEEATEDIQKLGGMEALDIPYIQAPFLEMVRKRAGWLAILFVGEMLTATAMGHYENEIAKAVVLALFVPLIISSGGNSGSQATTLVIRALALGEIQLRDWWRVLSRELAAGLALGSLLGTIGLARILLWQSFFHTYGEHFFRVAVTVAFSLVGIVTWGAVTGSMLPFLLKRVGFDPASASAPFVATLVDVSGLVIYFTVAEIVMRGTLL